MCSCVKCGDEFPDARRLLGYSTCLSCGEQSALKQKHCVVPMHKSNYMLVTDKKLLPGMNNKGGIVK